MTAELTLLSRVSYRGEEITGARLRGLLALLADDLLSGCGISRLVEGLWPDERPENPPKALQILVSRVRARLGSDIVARTATGYRLSLREDQVDAAAVLAFASESARCAAAGDHAAALAHAEAGLVLWDGVADEAAVLDDPLAALRARRVPAYRSLVRARALALSRLGHPAEAVEPLADVAGERPRDEEVLLELLRCESATAGPSAALTRYDAYRRSLRDELGSEPGDALQALYLQLLQSQAPRVRRGVPEEPNQLLGRADDIAAVANLLRSSRVTSIVGPGGLGKTRLALAVSRQAEQRTVHLVALAGVAADDDVVDAVASALGVGESRRGPVGHVALPPDVLAGIVTALGPGPALLALDNCEHVVRGAADLVHALVSTTADVRVLTTSRAPLGLSSESVYQLPELDLATAVELFGQRARAARPGVPLPTDAVEELCRHLDGLPLAVELAAARVRTMSVAEIARRLDDRFGLLRGGPRDAPERHHTLHAVVDWSWNLLGLSGQAAMRVLSVFPGGFTADAARQLLAGSDGDVLEVLEHLVGQSLLKATDTPSGTRFRMLETVREFSAAKRDEAGETDRVIGGFLAWARESGVANHQSLLGAEPMSAAEWVHAEEDNLVHALRLGLARADGATVAATSAVLAALWTIEGNYARMVTLVDETAWLLSHFRPAPDLVEATRAAATLCTANTFMMQGPRAVRSLVTLRRLPPADPSSLVGALATVLVTVSGPGSGRSALDMLCESPEPLVASVANGVASYVSESEGDHGGALKAARRMLDASRSGGTPWIPILAHSRIGELCLQTEQGDEARRHLIAALHVQEALNASPQVLQIPWALVLANLQLGDIDEAERWLELAERDGVGDAYGMVVFDLGVRAEVRLARGDLDAGLRLWRRAVDALADTRSPLFRIEPTGLEPWALEVQAACVVSHAQHGRLDLVEDIVGRLPGALSAMLANPVVNPPSFVMELAVCGALLLALGMVDLDRGARTGEEHATVSGVRMVALAERFHFVRVFHPAMSSTRARRAAEQADRSAYEAATSSYAGLDRDRLRAAALSVLHARGQDDGSRLNSVSAHR